MLVTPPPSDLTERTPLAPGELREFPLVPLDAYWVLVLHVGRGIAPAATAEEIKGRGVRWKGTMRWQIRRRRMASLGLGTQMNREPAISVSYS